MAVPHEVLSALSWKRHRKTLSPDFARQRRSLVSRRILTASSDDRFSASSNGVVKSSILVLAFVSAPCESRIRTRFIIHRGRQVQGSVIIHAALLDIRAEPEKEFRNLGSLPVPGVFARMR